MLVRTNGLDCSVESSTPLGANRPRLPAVALFFQHLEQSHAVAVALGYSKAFAIFSRILTPLLLRPRCHCLASSASPFKFTHHGSRPRDITSHLLCVDALAQRSAPNRHLAPGFHRQPRRMARPTHAPAPRRHSREILNLVAADVRRTQTPKTSGMMPT